MSEAQELDSQMMLNAHAERSFYGQSGEMGFCGVASAGFTCLLAVLWPVKEILIRQLLKASEHGGALSRCVESIV